MIDVDVGTGSDLARDEDRAGRRRGLACDARIGVVDQDGVEHRVRDLVAQLVGMALRDRLAGEEQAVCVREAVHAYVPDFHEAAYRRCSSDISSMRMPIAASFDAAMRSSISRGTG